MSAPLSVNPNPRCTLLAKPEFADVLAGQSIARLRGTSSIELQGDGCIDLDDGPAGCQKNFPGGSG
jgi:hypothetical protein